MWQRCIACALVLFVASCGNHNREPEANAPEDLAFYASLPGLRQSSNPALQAELSRLIADEATPQLLHKANQHRRKPSLERRSIKTLNTIFPEPIRASLNKRLDNVWPENGFAFSPSTLQVIGQLLNRQASRREKYRELVRDSGVHVVTDHTQGLATDTSVLDAVHIGNRLEGLHAARRLAADDLRSAFESLRILFAVIESVADEPRILYRSFAARERAAALQIVQGIAQHPAATQATHRELAILIRQQLEQWPQDSRAWIGDRAQGMHTFELVRDGYLLSLLSYDEIREYRDKVGIQELAQIVGRNVDADELFYLKTMREVIEACDEPFFKRKKLFDHIAQNLEALRGESSYPFVSDQLLLLDLPQGHRLQALDRARCEAWALALRLATDPEEKKRPINPLTGRKFIVQQTSERVVVGPIDPANRNATVAVPKR